MDYVLQRKVRDALVSGEFVQGNGALKRVKVTTNESKQGGTTVTTTTVEAKHCCLGVMGEVAAEFFAEKGENEKCNFFHVVPPSRFASEVAWSKVGIGGATAKFSDQQLTAIGMSPQVQNILIALNDGGGTFELISKVLDDLLSMGDAISKAYEDNDKLRKENYDLRFKNGELQNELSNIIEGS